MSQPPWSLRPATAVIPNPSLRSDVPARPAPRPESPGSNATPPIIAICHLSWEWVWQRPQQFLSRLARHHRVLFVETHCAAVPTSTVSRYHPIDHRNLTVLRIELPAARWADGAFIDRERREVLQRVLRGELAGEFEQALLWFNDPMAVVAYAGHLGERAIVYDCMDELTQFRGAPPELASRERQLLACADVVFCGGQKMRLKRLPLNPNTHFFGTGVDVAHFGRALSSELGLAPEIAALRGQPVLGYFGVIDERIDYELLAKLAAARPDWHVVMVGPTAKVNPAAFPRSANLHWLGARPYSALPAFTKGFSVALMPFARNAATEYINPTKALEYMAAGRPVVSTALDEVRMNFGRVARVADSHVEFIAYCAEESAEPSRKRIERGLRLAAQQTWELIVAQMEERIAAVLSSPRRANPSRQPNPAGNLGALPNLAYV